ncbi:MAG: glycosyltransferase [Phycisphaerae bacterium]|nr:glycosyltransferase [Phycisphaerae bacterium]
MVKVHILFEFKQGPWGGGNQFLKSLKKYLHSIDAYDENIATASAVLFNSHQYIDEVVKAKINNPEKVFIHRIDGPMRLYSRPNDKRDNVVLAANRYLADATVFQSEWSRQQNHRLGLHQKSFEIVIPNAPEPTIFNRNENKSFSTNRKTRLIATSWSPNWKKGFDVYKWLDENLDFDRYEMTFVGKSPVQFKNIRTLPPLSSEDIAEKLKENDIFIFASPIEACSNSLLEALHCGLPVVGPDQSSTPELIGDGGETFSKSDEIPHLLEKITGNYHKYQTGIHNPSMEDVGKRYYDFIVRVQSAGEKVKSFSWVDRIRLRAAIAGLRFSERLGGIAAAVGSSR